MMLTSPFFHWDQNRGSQKSHHQGPGCQRLSRAQCSEFSFLLCNYLWQVAVRGSGSLTSYRKYSKGQDDMRQSGEVLTSWRKNTPPKIRSSVCAQFYSRDKNCGTAIVKLRAVKI